MYEKLRKTLFPLLAAFIWGTAFVAQVGNELGTLTFNSFRSYIALLFIIPAILVQNKGKVREIFREEDKTATKKLILGGILCGIALSVASFFQQSGIDAGTESGKAGFITAMYIVLVPVLGIFLKKKSSFITWLSVIIAGIGLYLLCIKNGFSIRPSDAYVMASALAFAIHIHIIDKFSVYCNGFKLSCIQFITVGTISLIGAFITGEKITWVAFCDSLIPLLYVGIFSSGIAYTLQIISQKGANPTVTSVLMSMESLFSVIAGAVLLGELFTAQEYVGCALMLIAVIITQLPTRKNTLIENKN